MLYWYMGLKFFDFNIFWRMRKLILGFRNSNYEDEDKDDVAVSYVHYLSKCISDLYLSA